MRNLVVAMVVLGLSASAWADRPKVAILGLAARADGKTADRATRELATDLTDGMRSRSRMGPGVYVIAPGSDVDLAKLEKRHKCASEAPACMAKVGAALAADFLIYGSIERDGKRATVSISLFDVNKRVLTRKLLDTIPRNLTDDTELARWSKSLYDRITGVPDKHALRVATNVEHGELLIEGESRAIVVGGRAQIDGLSEGRYKVTLLADGYRAQDVIVTVVGDADTTVSIDLQPAKP